jgi:hypothetical protein
MGDLPEGLPDLVGETINVWFSCGAASAVAARATLDLYGAKNNVRILNNPIAEEDADNRRFLRDVEEWLGVRIFEVTHPDFPTGSCQAVWGKRKFMSSPYGAPCTSTLKIAARQLWERDNGGGHTVLGFTADEAARAAQFEREQRALLKVLIACGMTKRDCFLFLRAAGLRLPRVYSLGYPNGNCIGCVKASSPTYWNHVRKTHPDAFATRAKTSRELGARLVRVKGERIFLDELDPSAKGKPLKEYTLECGIFCPTEDSY